MSARLEQSAEELSFLVGATVRNVQVVVDDKYGDGEEAIEIAFDLKPGTVIDGETAVQAGVQIWQDPEGNGPGFAALMWTKVPA